MFGKFLKYLKIPIVTAKLSDDFLRKYYPDT